MVGLLCRQLPGFWVLIKCCQLLHLVKNKMQKLTFQVLWDLTWRGSCGFLSLWSVSCLRRLVAAKQEFLGSDYENLETWRPLWTLSVGVQDRHWICPLGCFESYCWYFIFCCTVKTNVVSIGISLYRAWQMQTYLLKVWSLLLFFFNVKWKFSCQHWAVWDKV